MPRTARASQRGYCDHILNHGNAHSEVFHKEDDYAAFLKLLVEANERLPMRVLACCLMPNHFHLVVRPRRDLRECVRRNRPYGDADWQLQPAKQLGLASSLRARGRPPLVAFHDAVARVCVAESAPGSVHSEELCHRVSALRNMLIDALGNGNFDSALQSMLTDGPSGNISASRLVLEFDQLPELEPKRSALDRGSDRDITGACHRILNSGAARHFARSGSMLVLEKQMELPAGVWA